MTRPLWIYALIFAFTASTAEAGFRPQLESSEIDVSAAPAKLVRPSSTPKLTGRSNRPDLEFQRRVIDKKTQTIQPPQVALPKTKKRRLPEPPVYDLKNWDSEKIRAFSETARKMPLPNNLYTVEVRANAVLEKYADALTTITPKKFRSKYKMSLLKVKDSIPTPPPEIAFEIWVARLDALFQILWEQNPAAVSSLWQLSKNKENPPELQARDALFAAEGALRAGWLRTASMALSRALDLNITSQADYNATLWSAITRIDDDKEEALTLVERSIKNGAPNPIANDRVQFLLAEKNLQNEKLFKQYAASINNPELKNKISLLHALNLIEQKKINEAKPILEALISSTTGETRNEALINLARISIQEKNPKNALWLYSQVEKNGKNRLDTILETAFAEYQISDFAGSLGKAIALQSPYFAYGFTPDSFPLEILSRKALCDFGGAQNSLEKFFLAYSPELQGLHNLLKISTLRKASIYEKIISFYQEESPLKYQRYLLHLPAIARRQAYIYSVTNEAKRLANIGTGKYDPKTPSDWPEFIQAVVSFHRPSMSSRMKKIEQYAVEETKILVARLERAFSASDLIRLDIGTKATKDFSLQSALNFPIKPNERSAELKNKILWPYENEVWEDELDYLRIKGDGKCANRELASAPSAEARNSEAAADGK